MSFLVLYWVKPENMFALHVCAVDVCLDKHPWLAVYTFSQDVGQRLEKTCKQLGCAHQLAFFPRLGQRIKKMINGLLFFLIAPRIKFLFATDTKKYKIILSFLQSG